jgi:hypothetical protein
MKKVKRVPAARLVSALAALLLSTGMVAACGGDDDDAADSAAAPEGSFVGAVEGSDAYVAVVSNGEEVVAGYLCDGRKVSTWIDRVPVEDGEAELVDRQGQRIGEVTLDSDSASGEIDVDGETLAFSAERAEGEAGLYREAIGTLGKPGSSETGWIVLADGSVRGATTKFIDSESDFIVEPAPPRTGAAAEVTPKFMELGVGF